MLRVFSELCSLSLHDALPILLFPISSKIILLMSPSIPYPNTYSSIPHRLVGDLNKRIIWNAYQEVRSEEHTSELQSPCNLVCRLLLENKNRRPERRRWSRRGR